MNSSESLLLIQRNYRRYKIKERTLAIFDVAIPFHIIDISCNGLSFRYIGHEKWFDDPVELDIVYENFFLKKMPVKTMSDSQLKDDFIQTRRHSVQFHNLNQSQIEKLQCFIANCSK